MAIVRDLVQRKNEYHVGADTIYRKTKEFKRFVMGKDGKPDPEKVHAVTAWSENAEEIVAVSYDIDRMETEMQYCKPDEQGNKLRKAYSETVDRLKRRLIELERDRPGIEENLRKLIGRS